MGMVAGFTGVSVRTLHHYDEICLLEPGQRNAAGYRFYSPQDLQRLQRILFYRELGFGLGTIAAILADPGSTGGDHLQRQRQLLAGRIGRYTQLINLIDTQVRPLLQLAYPSDGPADRFEATLPHSTDAAELSRALYATSITSCVDDQCFVPAGVRHLVLELARWDTASMARWAHDHEAPAGYCPVCNGVMYALLIGPPLFLLVLGVLLTIIKG